MRKSSYINCNFSELCCRCLRVCALYLFVPFCTNAYFLFIHSIIPLILFMWINISFRNNLTLCRPIRAYKLSATFFFSLRLFHSSNSYLFHFLIPLVCSCRKSNVGMKKNMIEKKRVRGSGVQKKRGPTHIPSNQRQFLQ